MLKDFLKPNKFKISFLIIFIVISFIVFIVDRIFNVGILKSIFQLIYSPAILLVNLLCLPFGEEICESNLIVFKILSIPIFIFCVYILACLINIKGGKENSSLKLGLISIILFFITSTIGYEVIWDLGVPKMLGYGKWYVFLICLPIMITAGFSLVYGAESLKSTRRITGFFGILFSLLSLFLVIIWLVGGSCC